MNSIGEIQIYVTEFQRALTFWSEGLGLRVGECELSPHGAFARLDFADESPSIRLLCADQPWEPGARPPVGLRPTVRFDLTTDDFEPTLIRLLEQGGSQQGEIEKYNGLRVVTVADPDGNTFELLELPADDG